jgi:hypothetical protein
MLWWPKGKAYEKGGEQARRTPFTTVPHIQLEHVSTASINRSQSYLDHGATHPVADHGVLVDGIQVHKVEAVSQSKSNNV